VSTGPGAGPGGVEEPQPGARRATVAAIRKAGRAGKRGRMIGLLRAIGRGDRTVETPAVRVASLRDKSTDQGSRPTGRKIGRAQRSVYAPARGRESAWCPRGVVAGARLCACEGTHSVTSKGTAMDSVPALRSNACEVPLGDARRAHRDVPRPRRGAGAVERLRPRLGGRQERPEGAAEEARPALPVPGRQRPAAT